VTITHPHHPLRGQQLPIVSLRRGAHPDVIVGLPDGSHAAVALNATDYATVPLATPPQAAVTHLLDLHGLRQLARLINEHRRHGRLPDLSG
jgi:hypothetical protein